MLGTLIIHNNYQRYTLYFFYMKSLFLNQLIEWALKVHKIEKQLKNEMVFSQGNTRIFDATKCIEFARMSVRDMVRLVELGKDARSTKRWIPASCEYIFGLDDYGSEKAHLSPLKEDVRNIFYALIDYDFLYEMAFQSDFHTNEFSFYLQRLQNALYDCDRNLGLRLGEINS